jgi:hypothetical protein
VIKISNHPTKIKNDSVLILKKLTPKMFVYEYDATCHHWDGKVVSFK